MTAAVGDGLDARASGLPTRAAVRVRREGAPAVSVRVTAHCRSCTCRDDVPASGFGR